MKFIRGIALLMVITVSGILGCTRQQQPIVAKIGDRVITLEEFNKRIERLPKHYRKIVSKQKRDFLNEIIKEELLYMEAMKMGVDKDPEVRELIAEARKKIIASRLIKNRVEDKIAVDEEAVRRYYDEHSEEFMLPERWRASHILVDTLEEAQNIREKLQQGASFEKLAMNLSLDASANREGDIGYFSKGQLVPEFEEAAFALEVGEISDIVKTQFGYHIIKLTDKKSPEVQEFSTIKELIKKELEREEKKHLLEKLMQELENSYEITINEDMLTQTSSSQQTQREE